MLFICPYLSCSIFKPVHFTALLTTELLCNKTPCWKWNPPLPSGTRPNCRPLLRFKDNLKDNLLSMATDPTTWEDLADNRSKWQKLGITVVQHFEAVCIATAVEKRSRRKGSTSQSVPAAESSDTRPFTWDYYCWQFTARIVLVGRTWR